MATHRDNVFLLVISLILGFSTSLLIKITPNDLDLYLGAYDLFWSGQNPYSINLWQKFWNSPTTPPMVWNPPELFIILIPIKVIHSFGLWATSTVFILLSFHTTYLLYRTINKGSPSLFNIIIFSLLNVSVLSCYFHSQISIFLSWLLAISINCFSKRGDRIAGLVAALTLIKPHIFGPALLVITLGSIKERRFQFSISVIICLSALSLITEILSPGIHHLWAFRETWPTNFYGATLFSLLTFIMWQYSEIDFRALGSISIALLLFYYLIINIRKSSSQIYEHLPLILLLTPFISPYGFTFDFILCSFPYIWLSAAEEKNRTFISTLFKSSYSLRAYIIIFIITMFLAAAPPTSTFPIWWIAQTFFLLLLWRVSQKTINNSSLGFIVLRGSDLKSKAR